MSLKGVKVVWLRVQAPMDQVNALMNKLRAFVEIIYSTGMQKQNIIFKTINKWNYYWGKRLTDFCLC